MEDDGDDELGKIRSPMESEAEADEMDTEKDSADRSSDSKDNSDTTTAAGLENHQLAAPDRPQPARIWSLKSDAKDGISAETAASPWSMCLMSRTKKRTVVQHPSAALFLRGLWEEEEHCRRQKQMIPEGVHKPLRSKVLNRKPLVRTGAAAATNVSSPTSKPQGLSTGSGSSSNLEEDSSSVSLSSSEISTSTSPVGSSAGQGDSSDRQKSKEESDVQSATNSNAGDQNMFLRKKYGPTAALRCKSFKYFCPYVRL
jgi:hypothetical protein